MSARSVQRPESAFLVVNRPSGNGQSEEDIERLRAAFDDRFRWIDDRTFAVAEGHDEVVNLTREFLAAVKGPCFLLSGGGGGTNRALVQGFLEEIESGTVGLDDVLISSLRLGSGNLIPKHFGMPRDPLEGMKRISADLDARQARACCVYRCTLHYPDGMTRQRYGLTMGGLGQFARVPDDIKRWRDAHRRLMRCASRVIPLEAINTFQYTAFSALRAIRCIARPECAERVEIRHAHRRDRFRLFAGILLNFDFPQLPIRGGCDIGEPRLVLCCIPCEGRRQTVRTLLDWRNLDRRIRKYEITPGTPIDVEFVDHQPTTLALDEDTFTAPARIGFEVAGLVRFVAGTPTGWARPWFVPTAGFGRRPYFGV
ncbi:MAG TPA: diacylglycerol kinase family protein [Anaerolineae bacterium]|nr:diacylglycerol kinase family protein [Anaerolineae bacterium]